MPIITIVILVNSTQDKTSQGKARQGKARNDEIYIDSLHIMTTTMTIIIQ